MKTRHEPDGTVTVTLEDGRRFSLADDGAVMVVRGIEEDLIIRPVDAATVEIDTPYS